MWQRKGVVFPLHPKDGSISRTYESRPGIVKDFVWKINGPRADSFPSQGEAETDFTKFYGGAVQFTIDLASRSYTEVVLRAGSKVRLDLTPSGSMADGSKGKPYRRTWNFSKDVLGTTNTLYALDVPVGEYTAQLTYVAPDANERAIPIRLALDSDAPFSTTAKVACVPGDYGSILPTFLATRVEAAS